MSDLDGQIKYMDDWLKKAKPIIDDIGVLTQRMKSLEDTIFILEQSNAELMRFHDAIQAFFSGSVAPMGSLNIIMGMTPEERQAAINECFKAGDLRVPNG